MSFNTFHLFPKLPIELRLKIWSEVPEARVVEIEWFEQPESKWIAPAESAHRPCGLLGVNKEARAEYLKRWSPLCEHKEPWGHAYCAHGKICYFNPDVDTLYIGPSTQELVCTCPDSVDRLSSITNISRLRFLAFETAELIDAPDASNDDDWEVRLFSIFPNLEFIIVGFHDIEWRKVGISNADAPRPDGVITFSDIIMDDLCSSHCAQLQTRFEVHYKELTQAYMPPLILKDVSRGFVTRPSISLYYDYDYEAWCRQSDKKTTDDKGANEDGESGNEDDGDEDSEDEDSEDSEDEDDITEDGSGERAPREI
jgi:hypothetical protein